MSLSKRLINTGGGALDFGLDGKYVLVNTNYDGFYLSSDYGMSFNLAVNDPEHDQGFLGISGNGQYMFYFPYVGYFYHRSTNYGVSWSKLQNFGTYFGNISVEVSLTGQYVYVTRNNRYYRSSDYGATFSLISSITDTNYSIQSVAVSASGQNVFITPSQSTNYYVSNNYGVTFTSYNPSKVIYRVTMDSTGQYILGDTGTQDETYYSTNYGVSFSVLRTGGYQTEKGMTNDRQNMYIGSRVGYPVYSQNEGVTWANFNPVFSYGQGDYLDMGYTLNTIVRQGTNGFRIDNDRGTGYNYTPGGLGGGNFGSVAVNKYIE